MRIIDGDALYKRLQARHKISSGNARKAYENVIDDVCDAPTIDPVKHGSWQEGSNGDLVCACGQLKAYYLNLCSACKEPSPHRYRYCPNCGAKMDDEELHLDRLHREMLQECSCETRLTEK